MGFSKSSGCIPVARNMASARALWRATGVQPEDFEKPIIAATSADQGAVRNLEMLA